MIETAEKSALIYSPFNCWSIQNWRVGVWYAMVFKFLPEILDMYK